MDWMQTLIVAAVPAIVAACALLYQGSKTARREREREARETRRLEFEELRAAHLEMLYAISEYWRQCDRPARSFSSTTSGPAILHPELRMSTPSPVRLDLAYTALMVEVPKEQADVAGTALVCLGQLGEALGKCSRTEGPYPEISDVLDRKEKARAAREAYADLVRDEIKRLRPAHSHEAPEARSRR